MANAYLIGQTVRLSVAFTDADGAAADPGSLTFTLRAPSGASTTYTYGTDAALVKDSTGNYHVDWAVSQEGIHWYSFAGTGLNAAVDEGWFWGDEVRTTA